MALDLDLDKLELNLVAKIMAATQRRPQQDGEESKASATAAAHNDTVPASSKSEAVPLNGKPKKGRKPSPPATTLEWGTLAMLIFLTYTLMPHPLHPEGEPSVQHVFYYGWLTAVSTGFGVVPLIFAPNLPSFWVGVSNGTFRFVSC